MFIICKIEELSDISQGGFAKSLKINPPASPFSHPSEFTQRDRMKI